ncbi:MAG: AAA family ATPase [Proteobacteria bacterium]|nr:AAA family ATPase [Pseudomonadota bacterium]
MYSFSPDFFGSFDIAQTFARHQKHGALTPWHLIYGMAKNPNLGCWHQLSGKMAVIEKELNKCPKVSGEITTVVPNQELMRWLQEANALATESSATSVSESHILSTLPKEVKAVIGDIRVTDDSIEKSADGLDFLINLNELCRLGKIDPLIGREEEIRSILEVLSRKSKNNPILLGEAGVGKTAVVEGLAYLIIQKDVPEKFLDYTIYSLDISRIMAGTQYRGGFEKKIQKMLRFVKEQHGKAIIFFDEIHMIVGAGKTEGSMDAANLLKPSLARGDLKCIGATTFQEYQKYIMTDSALDRRFRPIKIAEPSPESTIEILLGIRDRLEAHHGLTISSEAIYNAVFLSDQYVWERHFPDKAIDLIDEACASKKFSIESMPSELIAMEALLRRKKTLAKTDRADDRLREEIKELEATYQNQKSMWLGEVKKIREFAALKKSIDSLTSEQEMAEREGNYEKASRLKYSEIPALEESLAQCKVSTSLVKEDVADVLSRRTGIPKERILTSKQERILELESFLRRQVFGQDEALKEIAETLISSYAGLGDSSRPLGSFLLMGPSGVGKTETARALSEFFLNSKEKVIRLDLSEYSERHSVAKLIGSPSGYVGYEEGGILTEAVRKNPYAVILFDEIEKAHPDFCDILLQILDHGCLTDNKGRKISFRNSCIILTTNAKEVEKEMKPEVLGRLDAILTYHHLSDDIYRQLIDRELRLLNRALQPKHIVVTFAGDVKSLLFAHGFNRDYGARPLKAYFKKVIARPLARIILRDSLANAEIHMSVKTGTKDELNLIINHINDGDQREQIAV